VSKTFADPGASQAAAFAVTTSNAPVDLSQLTKTVSGSGSFAWVNDGVDGKFTLTHDASVKFDGLAQGTYTVTEDVPSGFDAPGVTVSGAAGSKETTNGAEIVMTENDPAGSAAFTNKKTFVPAPTVSLTVSKTFADPGASQAVAFAITTSNAAVDLSQLTKTVSGSGSFAWVTNGTDGKFTLTHGASVAFKGLTPKTYVVTENVPNGFKAPDVTISGGAGSKNITNGAEVVMSENNPVGSVAFVNKKTTTPVPDAPISTPTQGGPTKPTPELTTTKPTPNAPTSKPTKYIYKPMTVDHVRYTSAPKTGDTSKAALWVIIIAASALALGLVLWRRRKVTACDHAEKTHVPATNFDAITKQANMKNEQK
jgi:LPXTG-motif cell wall-anchored protein